MLRLQGVENIRAVRSAMPTPIIGLIKRHHDGYEPYITPTLGAVDELVGTDCECVGLDGTRRARPDGSSLGEAVAAIHAAGKLALADCDVPDSVDYALACGADIISTTLAGYTGESTKTSGPDLEFLRAAVARSPKPVFGEGRYGQRWHVEAALRMGASGVVVGGALNDPLKQTTALMPSSRAEGPIAAADLGGTWLRFGLFDPDWKLIASEKVATPKTHAERAAWVAERVGRHGACRLGIGAGGTIDPCSNRVVESKPLISDHALKDLSEYGAGKPVLALNDGLATAWGHACLPEFAGRRVATLALGTGVGCGFVADQRIWMGRRGEYPRVNDFPFGSGTIEDALGGFSNAGGAAAAEAALAALKIVRETFFPDVVVVCGGVGLGTSMALDELGLVRSPFGEDAGLYGAAALALFDSWR